MVVLHAEGLTKQFGKVQALNGVNMEVKEGEVYGFIGPNGAGKSTTIRILLGILKASSGRASIFGKDVWRDAVDIHKRLAYVPGDVNLWSSLTGGEVIDFFTKMRGAEIDKKRKENLIDRFQLDPTKKCGTYSKGNRQKVALVSAFAADADLYILDEPTSGLDPLMERVFQECVMEAKEQGKSVILSSHILSEVERLCDTVGIIRQGEIIESGTLQDLRHLTRTNLLIETKTELTLQGLPGIHDVQQDGNTYQLQVDTEHLDQVIQHVSQSGVVKLESAPPTLEDLFMRHYEGEAGGVK
ncbi:ABC transporter ATP-binding protein [Tenuibacillus multivorans]|uniref:ABC-2 type transport system ATP-binding protein n=1 Tax=Tenuibacillus multivorans TaxID=237069 RepID=A0A1H0ALV2_9BACI|nr:ABC transporter ATP-binding protein [Tenuibacillus multivorans]GEL78197.1 ABC transporter ATP-binding protein [Tenuibacillus multivorans]SDN34379.1 ABC-2 type transport system ATP-binding protein [Tenuibacillus multivorans]